MDVNLFDFFSVAGHFEFVQSQGQAVKLSDGSTLATPNLLTLGGADVQAFAGLKFADGDRVGLALGGVNFGLALLADPADATRKFASLQATADSAGFSGLDVLNIAATDLRSGDQPGRARAVEQPATTTQIERGLRPESVQRHGGHAHLQPRGRDADADRDRQRDGRRAAGQLGRQSGGFAGDRRRERRRSPGTRPTASKWSSSAGWRGTMWPD